MLEDKLLSEFHKFLSAIRVLLRTKFRGVIVCRFHVDAERGEVKLHTEITV